MELANYKNFLLEKDLYFQNVKFWSDTVINLSESKLEEWAITKFANGEDFADGNPIFSAFYPGSDKAIRIIQLSIDENTPALRVWLDKVSYANKSIKELILILQPTNKAYISAVSLITLFLSEQTIGKYINAYNTFYKKEVDLKGIGLDLNKARSNLAIKPFTELSHLNTNHLRAKTLDINLLKKIYRKILVQKRSLKKMPIRYGFKKIDADVRREIDTIINILTIGHSVNFNNDLNKDTYIDLVEKKYGIDNYVYTLRKTSSHIDVLNKEFINGSIK